MTIKQAYEAYCAECARTDTGSHGVVLREATSREQELYNAWQQAIRDCTTWRDEETGTTWHILHKWDNCGLEMWYCRIEEDGKPAVIADCYASYVREMASPVEACL